MILQTILLFTENQIYVYTILIMDKMEKFAEAIHTDKPKFDFKKEFTKIKDRFKKNPFIPVSIVLAIIVLLLLINVVVASTLFSKSEDTVEEDNQNEQLETSPSPTIEPTPTLIPTPTPINQVPNGNLAPPPPQQPPPQPAQPIQPPEQKDCNEPNQGVKNEIDEKTEQLKQLQSELTDMQNELSNKPLTDPDFGEKAEAYNNKINEHNALGADITRLMNEYNEQVNSYNQCIRL